MGWLVSISGDYADLEELSKSFTSKKLYITKDRDGFVLGSEDFDSLTDHKEVSSMGKEIISSLNGSARLFLGIRKPLESGAVIEVDASGKRNIFVETLALSLHIKVGTVGVKIVRRDGTVEESHPADPIPALITLAQKDKNVSKVLRLYGSGNYDWVNIYRIYEVIENDMRGAAFLARK
ncbi:MAG: hypothetical protein PHE18_08350 [Candidatus Omnitrophica bacterium]|nr:hypothetical protein [Candidatus Omnitrophota bacterium]MDD5553862.1 hypothetical protein [Candidatus Omnitrophota bacterium]